MHYDTFSLRNPLRLGSVTDRRRCPDHACRLKAKVPIENMRKVMLRKVQWFSLGLTVRKWLSQDLNSNMVAMTSWFWSIKPFDPMSLQTKLSLKFVNFHTHTKRNLCNFLFGWTVSKARYLKNQISISFLQKVWFSYWTLAVINNLFFSPQGFLRS